MAERVGVRTERRNRTRGALTSSAATQAMAQFEGGLCLCKGCPCSPWGKMGICPTVLLWGWDLLYGTRASGAWSRAMGRRKQGSEQLLQNKGGTKAALGRENAYEVSAISEQKLRSCQPARWYFPVACSTAAAPPS